LRGRATKQSPANTLEIRVNGYITEILCGQIPIPAKEALAGHLLENRDEADIPEWLKRRNPTYVSQEEIKRLWYSEDEMMHGIMKKHGFSWSSYMQVNDFCHQSGFGSGKGDIGLFEISVFVGSKTVTEFIPVEPTIETGHELHKIEDIKVAWLNPESLPRSSEGQVAVSAGSWAKGTMVFRTEIEDEFDHSFLELLVQDLSNLGSGEDHFVAGLRYAGRDLVGQIVRAGDREFFQVSWYHPERGRWLEMHVP